MNDEELKLLKYPVGRFRFTEMLSAEQVEECKDALRGFPELLEETLQNVSQVQLGWRYRPDGWTIQQVVHHLADSHMNSFIRFKLALTEQEPVIKPYLEGQWAELPDANNPETGLSLDILRGVHQRWSILMDGMEPGEWALVYTHPEHGRKIRLDQTLDLYVWHCNHHLAHIKQALESNGQFNG